MRINEAIAAGQLREFYLQVSQGNIPGHSVGVKFGRNPAVGTSYVPVSVGGVYQTPQVASATTLRVKAGGHANDTAAGSGAREVTLIGLDANGDEVTEAVATAGASASGATTATFIRLYRFYVSASGTYATAAAGSHSSAITIENGAGGTDWGTIYATNFPRGQSEVAAFTVPTGYTMYIVSGSIFTDAAKTTGIIMFQRGGVLETAAPYQAMREKAHFILKGDSAIIRPGAPVPVPEQTDFGFMAKVDAGTAEVNVNWTYILVDNNYL